MSRFWALVRDFVVMEVDLLSVVTIVIIMNIELSKTTLGERSRAVDGV